MRATEGNWSKINPRLRPGEWPDGVLQHMDFRVIEVLSDLRGMVPSTHGFVPSPVPEAHVRRVGTSRHATTGGRLSDATDFFVDWSHVWSVWAQAQAHPAIGGLGIYTDMIYGGVFRSRAMLHIDLRPQRMLWVAYRGRQTDALKYTYHDSDPLLFHRILGERGLTRWVAAGAA